MSPLLRYDTNGLQVWEGDALAVAAEQPESSFTLAIFDGAYGLRKAAWDRLKVADLPRFYRPHLEAADRILAPSASLYLWNTAEGWATLHPLMVSMGWTFRTAIIWDKQTPPSMLGWKTSSAPIDTTEVCGFYQRGVPVFTPSAECRGNVWTHSTKALSLQTIRTGHLVPHRGTDGPQAESLHPCQKPLLFADWMIRASTRPGERVWVPFGGTCREAVAADKIRRADPTEAREVVSCELNQDGPDYLAPVIRILTGEGSAPINKMQAQLF